jgi:GTP diphosphokinase / guanosine-3',5'-bis(diphosphate) 3'-diphosphatase
MASEPNVKDIIKLLDDAS